MHVFRAAHEAKDAKKAIELRNEFGERGIAGRRLRPHRHRAVLRPEVDRYVDSRAFVGRLDIALAGSAEIVQDVVACGSLEEGRFGMAVASIAAGTAQPIRRCSSHAVPLLGPSVEPTAVALVCIP